MAARGMGGCLAVVGGTDGGVVCDSLDCGVYFERRKLGQEMATLAALTQASSGGLGDW